MHAHLSAMCNEKCPLLRVPSRNSKTQGRWITQQQRTTASPGNDLPQAEDGQTDRRCTAQRLSQHALKLLDEASQRATNVRSLQSSFFLFSGDNNNHSNSN